MRPPSPCTWFQDGEDSDAYDTTCGGRFTLEIGTPSENDMSYCCYCGDKLVERLWVEEESE